VTEPLDRDLTQSKGRIRPLMLLPNFMTLGAVCVGLTSVRFALDGRVDLAVIALVLAMILDGLDGRVARALNSTSRIGKELDTLADFFNFGIAPGLIVHLALFSESTRVDFTWVAIMVVAACCAYRLARFNAHDDTEVAKTFEGVPAPTLALLTLLPVYLHLLEFEMVTEVPGLVSAYLIFCGFLAVSQVPTVSLKSFKIPSAYMFIVVPLMITHMASLLIYPWETLTVMSVVYLLCMPIFAYRVRLLDR
jgi:CDP-diacylglycerol--serine O-phosphatidyltransferase